MICKVEARHVRGLLFAVLLVVFVGSSAWATPTGLNNIPTTDIVPEKVLVFQGWVNTAANTHPQQFVGFKYGLFKDVEIGVDWKAHDVTHAHATFQAKYAFDIEAFGIEDVWRGVVGLDGLSENRRHNGEFFPYVATSLDIQVVRLHAGYAPQPHNDRFFAGIDKWMLFLDRNLQLRADAIQTTDKKDVLYSVGFLYELGLSNGGDKMLQGGVAELLNNLAKNMILESWVSIPDASGPEVYTIKLNYVIKF